MVKKIILPFLLFLIFANLVYLDLGLFTKPVQSNLPQLATTIVPPSSPPNKIIVTKAEEQTYPQCYLDAILQATASAPKALTQVTQKQIVTSAIKEFFVPFGSESIIATDWQDVPGLQAYVDTANYYL